MPRGFLRRAYNKGKKILKKRYVSKRGGVRVARIAKDVMYLKSLVNTEKKSYIQQGNLNTSLVGQVNVNASGHYLLDLTPGMGQGTGYQQRIGNSVKWTSSHMQFLFQPQSGTTKPQQLEIHIVKVVGQPFATMSDVMGKYIAPNPFVTDQTIYDVNSSRETDYFKNFRVIRRKTVRLDPAFSGERCVKTINIGFKLKNHHIKWNADTATVSEGQIFLLITCDNGNHGASNNTSTSNGVITQTLNTGVAFCYNHTHYFIDN